MGCSGQRFGLERLGPELVHILLLMPRRTRFASRFHGGWRTDLCLSCRTLRGAGRKAFESSEIPLGLFDTAAFSSSAYLRMGRPGGDSPTVSKTKTQTLNLVLLTRAYAFFVRATWGPA